MCFSVSSVIIRFSLRELCVKRPSGSRVVAKTENMAPGGVGKTTHAKALSKKRGSPLRFFAPLREFVLSRFHRRLRHRRTTLQGLNLLGPDT